MSFLLGVTRSRTLLYFSYRDSAPKKSLSPSASRFHNQNYTTNLDDDEGEDDDERRGLIPKDGSASSTIIDMAGTTVVTAESRTPPKWVSISEQIEQILTAILPKISALDKLHAKHVLPGFTDRSAEEREIQSITNDITRDFRRCQTLIQQISTLDSSSHTFPPKPRSLNGPAQNVQRALAAKVQELSSTFRKKQRVYMERLQGHSIKNQDILLASGQVRLKGQESISALEDDVKAVRVSSTSYAHTLSTYPTQSQSTTTPIPSSPSQTLITTQTQDTSSSLTQHRNQEISEIATSITQLAELFKDLSALVIDQGTILDSVEYNIEQTAVHLEDAHEDLIVGEKYQKKTGRRACIFLLLLIIVGLILVLIFKPRRRPPSTSIQPSPISAQRHVMRFFDAMP